MPYRLSSSHSTRQGCFTRNSTRTPYCQKVFSLIRYLPTFSGISFRKTNTRLKSDLYLYLFFFSHLPRYLDIFSSTLVLPSDYETSNFCLRDGSRCSISDLSRGAQVNTSSFILSLPETILSPSLCWHISYDKDLLISLQRHL
jgi:hypothetical protein